MWFKKISSKNTETFWSKKFFEKIKTIFWGKSQIPKIFHIGKSYEFLIFPKTICFEIFPKKLFRPKKSVFFDDIFLKPHLLITEDTENKVSFNSKQSKNAVSPCRKKTFFVLIYINIWVLASVWRIACVAGKRMRNVINSRLLAWILLITMLKPTELRMMKSNLIIRFWVNFASIYSILFTFLRICKLIYTLALAMVWVRIFNPYTRIPLYTRISPKYPYTRFLYTNTQKMQITQFYTRLYVLYYLSAPRAPPKINCLSLNAFPYNSESFWQLYIRFSIIIHPYTDFQNPPATLIHANFDQIPLYR